MLARLSDPLGTERPGSSTPEADPDLDGAVQADKAPGVVVSGLTKSFGHRRAVCGMSFQLDGGVTGLLGPNGAGKSTLVRCLAGLTNWNEGRIEIAGIDPARHPSEARDRVGFMPERVSFPSEMRVKAYLQFVAEAKGIKRSDRSAAITTALRRAGLTESASRVVANLSKGYRQRVGLAQAMLGEPNVLILDEPMAGLDPINAIEIRDVLRTYGREHIVLVSTHILPEVRQLCDRVLVMSQGRLVHDGRPDAILATAPARFQLRVRRAQGSPRAAVADWSGGALVEQRRDGLDDVLTVEASMELEVGKLVSQLAGDGHYVLGLERVGDALEDAFRHAVLGVAPDQKPDHP